MAVCYFTTKLKIIIQLHVHIVTIIPLHYQEGTNAPLISHLPLTYGQEKASDAAQMGH